MAAKDKSIYETFTIRSNDGSKTIDLRGGIVSFSYFENVFSPMITAQVLITTTGNVIADEDGDTTSIYNGLPLRGGEKVSFKIPANSENNVDLEFTEENGNELYVASITNVLIEAEKEIFTLNLVSREAITNETSRVGKKFPSSEPISDSVKEIIEKLLKLIDKRRILLPVPLFFGKLSAKFFQLFPKPLLTEDQLKLLKYDNVLSGKYKTNSDIGLPSNKYFANEINKYSVLWREGGQFSTEKYTSKNI